VNDVVIVYIACIGAGTVALCLGLFFPRMFDAMTMVSIRLRENGKAKMFARIAVCVVGILFISVGVLLATGVLTIYVPE